MSISKSTLFSLLGLMAVVCCPTVTSAAVFVDDNFESYANSAAFVAAWPAWSNTTTSGTTTHTTGVFVTTGGGAGGSTKWVSQPSTTSSNQNRNMRNIGETGNPSASNIIAFSFDFFDSNAASSPSRNHSNLHNGGPASDLGSGSLISMGLNNNQTLTANGGNFYMGRILGHTPTDTGATAGSFFKLNEGSAPLRSTGWHNLRVVITNSTTNGFRFYVDGILSRTIGNNLALKSYETVVLGSGLSQSPTAAGVDNVRVITDTAMAVVANGLSPANAATNQGADNNDDGDVDDVLLNWNDQTNDKWDLFLWKTSEAVPTTPVGNDLLVSQFTANDLEPETSYSWRVDSYNAFDDLATGNVRTFVTAAIPEPTSFGLFALVVAGMLRRPRRS